MERTITIVGKAELLVVPDQTTVTLQLKGTDSVYKKALDKLQEITAEIAEGVRTCGISAADIKTTNYYASAEKKLVKNRRGEWIFVDAGYTCNQTLQISFATDPVMLGELIEGLSKKLGSPDYSISFSVKDKSKYEEELLRKVTEDAQKKAMVFCGMSNAKTGKLISVNYNRKMQWAFSMPPRPMPIPVPPPQFPAPGETGELHPSHPAAPKPPAMPAAPVLPVNNIIPQEKRIEEEAVFVWEIVDA